MDIIQDILSESEVLDMPMETLSAFVRLFNVNMNQKVEVYMSMPDANPDVVEKLSMCVGDFVTESTFHLKVKDRDTKSLLMKNNMRDLPMLVYANDVDIDEFISELKWLSQMRIDFTRLFLRVREICIRRRLKRSLSFRRINRSCIHTTWCTS